MKEKSLMVLSFNGLTAGFVTFHSKKGNVNHSLLVLGIIIRVNATNITNRITLNGSHSFIYICSVDDEKGIFFAGRLITTRKKKLSNHCPCHILSLVPCPSTTRV